MGARVGVLGQNSVPRAAIGSVWSGWTGLRLYGAKTGIAAKFLRSCSEFTQNVGSECFVDLSEIHQPSYGLILDFCLETAQKRSGLSGESPVKFGQTHLILLRFSQKI